MPRIARLFFATLLFAAPALFAGPDEFVQPTPAELAMKSLPSAPGAPAAILNWDVKHDDDQSFANEHFRIKIFTAEGKKYGDIELPYVPGFSTLKNIAARVITPDGRAVPFNGKMYDKLVIKAGGFKVMQKSFSLPDVQPGSIVEYRYSRTWSLQQLMTNRWLVQREIPIVHATFWIRPYSREISSFFTYKGIPKAPEKVGDHFELTLDNIPAFESEPFAPPEDELKPNVQFFYTVGRPDVEKYWTDAGKALAEATENFIGDRRGIREAAQQIIAGATTPEEKLRKLYARVQQIRNLSYEAEKTEQEEKREKLHDNRHIEDVLKNGYGYRGELNRLFVGLARAAGFPANIVWVSQRDESFFAKQIPDSDQFKGQVALVVLDGKERYFDPGTPFTPFGLLSWENTNVTAMKVEKKSGGTWVTTPDQPSTVARTVRTADLQLVDDVLKGTVTVTYSGQEALGERLAAKNRDEAANKKAFEDEAKGWFPDGTTVKLTKVTALDASDEPLVLTYDVELANVGTVAGSRALLPLAVFTVARKNPFSSEQRKHVVYFSYAAESEDHVKLKLPDGYAVESLPQPQKIDAGAIVYTTEWKQAGGSVDYTRTFARRTIMVPAENYRAIRNVYAHVATTDQDALVLRKAK